MACTLLVVASIGLGVLLWRSGLRGTLDDQEALQALISRLGRWGPLAIVLAEIAQVLLAPVPGQVVGLAAGYLYGVLWGTTLCTLGLSMGSALAIWLARRFGRPWVERLAKHDLIERIDGYTQRRGALAIFVIFLLPFLPDDLTCFIAGLTPLPFGQLLLLALIGRTPGVVVSTMLGAQAGQLSWPALAAVSGLAITLGLLLGRHGARVQELMLGIVDHFTRER